MKCLVTGGAGFIGSHLVDALIKKRHQVSVIDDLSAGKKANLNPKARFYQIDISDNLASIFKKEKPEVVFHLAAQKNVRRSVQNPYKDAQINILGTLNLLAHCQNIKKFIFASSGGAIYGATKILPTPETTIANPLSPYGVSKLAIEKYLAVLKIPYVSLRYSNVYGPRQDPEGEAGVVAIFINRIRKGRAPIIFGSGRQTRDYIYVDDVVVANLEALKRNVQGAFNIGTSCQRSVNQLLKMIDPQARPIHESVRPGEVQRSCLDIKKAKHLLGWKPKTKLEEGIRLTKDYFRKQDGK